MSLLITRSNPVRPSVLGTLLTALLVTAALDSVQAATYTLTELKETPPKGVSPALAKAASKDGARILRRGKKPFIDIWFRDSAPRPKPEAAKKAKSGVTLTKRLDEGTFLGILRLHRKSYDFRDKGIPKGVYVMRYAIQPEDGDHLGASPTRDFVLLSPIDKDVKLDPILTTDLIKLSTQVSKTKHPSSLFLTSTTRYKDHAKLPLLFHEKKHNWHVVDFRVGYDDDKKESTKETKNDGGSGSGRDSAKDTDADTGLRLGLIVVGKAEE